MNKNSRRDMGFWYHREYDPVRNGSMDGTDVYAHDHGLVRASQCHYNWDRNSDFDGDPYKTLFVGRLSPSTTEETLQRAFSRYGKIKSLRLVRDLSTSSSSLYLLYNDLVTGCSKRYAFVEFVYEEDFKSAFFAGHRIQLDDSNILVDFMREQTVPGWIPRRLGGGVGGRKQSGQMRFGGRDCPFRAPFDPTLYRTRARDSAGSMSSTTSSTNKSTYGGDDRHSRNGHSHSDKTYEQRRDYRKEERREHTEVNRNEKSGVDHQQVSTSTTSANKRDSMDQDYSKREREDYSHSSNRSHSFNHTHHRLRRSRSRSRSKDYHHSHYSSSRHHSYHSSSHRHYHCLLYIHYSCKCNISFTLSFQTNYKYSKIVSQNTIVVLK